jgi:hypothetical protein
MMLSDDFRASDSDREDAVRILCEAYAAGRIDLDDIRDRTVAAYRASTWGDLRRLTADLPPPGHVPAGPVVVADARSGTGRADWPVAPVLLTVVAWMAIAAAACVPLVASPLAILPLSLVSMAALIAAGRIAERRGEAAGGNRRHGDGSGCRRA